MSNLSVTQNPEIRYQPLLFDVPTDLERLMDIPFVSPALMIPWREIFGDIEAQYYWKLYEKLRHEQSKQRDHVDGPNSEQLTWELPNEASDGEPILIPSKAGRKPHPFFPMFRAFLLAPLLKIEMNVESVYLQVSSNRLFFEVCGFEKLPSKRSFERFDQIMTENGLLEKARQRMVQINIDLGILPEEDTVCVDTTHVEAEATLGKTTKACDHTGPCDCPEVPTDDNVGLIRKSTSVSYVGHKTSLLSGAKGQVPLSRVVVRGNTPDMKTLGETLETFKQEYPKVARSIDKVLADGIYQNQDNQKICREVLDAKLYAPINARNRKKQKVEARGIDHIDQRGVPHCISGHPMIYLGQDKQKEQYIWGCPVHHPQAKDDSLCCECPMHELCCGQAEHGRVFRVDQQQTPQIDPEMPQHSQTFKKTYMQRTGIERVIGNLKEGFSLRRVHKRGKKAAEAHADRCILSMHIMVYTNYAELGKLYRGWSRKKAG